jgi:hypothetical protein
MISNVDHDRPVFESVQGRTAPRFSSARIPAEKLFFLTGRLGQCFDREEFDSLGTAAMTPDRGCSIASVEMADQRRLDFPATEKVLDAGQMADDPQPMSSELHRRVRELFDLALERTEPERLPFVQAACADQPEIFEAVVRLLNAHGRVSRFWSSFPLIHPTGPLCPCRKLP